MKKCRKCGTEKENSEFYKHGGHRDGLSSSCRTCVKAAAKGIRYADPSTAKLRNIKARAKGAALPFDLDQDWMDGVFANGKCRYCARDMSTRMYPGKRSAASFSLDRIVPELGYTKHNVVPCCDGCNSSKSNTPYAEWRENVLRLAKRLEQYPDSIPEKPE